jgi:hypothetical protein
MTGRNSNADSNTKLKQQKQRRADSCRRAFAGGGKIADKQSTEENIWRTK